MARRRPTMEDRAAALLRDGQAAARAGQRATARRKFRMVLMFDPANVAALLWLAWLSADPRASLAYVARALACDPANPRAHAALRWARRRAISSPAPQEPPSPPSPTPPVSRGRWGRPWVAVALGLLIVVLGGVLAWFLLRDLPVLAARAAISSPAATVTANPSPSPNPSRTPTPIKPPTLTATPSPTLPHTPPPTQPFPTETPRSTPTFTSTITSRPVPPTAPPLPPQATLAPLSVPSNVRWIDVDLTHQVLTAYVGRTPVHTTLVSTGLPRTPTPAGQYRIWTKLRSDDMSGPSYYLRNVPYVMYFYRGYGLHGTYWHDNFGHPMSHGCVNLPTPEAEWLFNWAEVGTLVNIHY
jgi:lipoprotein-anchoring transpeptidase ErfK/SrfK